MKKNIELYNLLRSQVGTTNIESLIYELIYFYYKYNKDGISNRIVEASYNSQNLLNLLIGKFDDYGRFYKDVVNDYERKVYKEVNLQPFYIYLDNNKEFINEFVLEDYETSIFSETTPASLTDLAIGIFETTDGNNILDLGSNKGSFLLKYGEKYPKKMYTGIDINSNSLLISRIRFEILDINVTLINKDIFDCNSKDNIIGYDKILSNNPFMAKLPFNAYYNNEFHLDQNNSSDWYFVSKMLDMLSDNGKGIAIVSNSSLQKMTDINIRKNLIENNFVETIISLPEKIFGYSNISSTMIVFNKSSRDKIKFIDASGLYKSNKKSNLILVDEVLALYNNNIQNNKMKLVDIKEIEQNDYNMTPSRYLDNNIYLVNPTNLEDVLVDVIRGYRETLEKVEENDLYSSIKSEYKILNVGNINNGIIDDKLDTINPKSKQLDKYLLKNGDLVMTAKSSRIKTAVVQISPSEKIVASGNLIILRPDVNKINPYYLKLFFDSENGNKVLGSIQTNSTIVSINISNLKNIKISLLDISEQEKLANKYLAKLDSIKIMKYKLQKMEEELNDIGKGCM